MNITIAAIPVHSVSQILAGLWVSVFLCLPGFAADLHDQDPIAIEFYDNGIRQLWLPEIHTGDRLWDDMPYPNGHSHLRTEETRLNTPNVAEFLFMMPSNEEIDRWSPQELNQRVSAQLKDSVMRRMAAGKTAFQIQIVQNIGFGDAKLESKPRDKIKDGEELLQTDHDGTYFDAMQQSRVRRFGQAVGVAITELVQSIKAEKKRDTALYFTPASNGGVLFTEAAPFLKPVKDNVKQVDLVESQASVASTVRAAKILGEEKFTLSTTRGNYPSPSSRTGSRDGIVEVLKQCPAARGFYTIPDSPKDPHIKRSAAPGEQLRFQEIVLYNKNKDFALRDAGVTSGETFRFQLRDANYRDVYSGNGQQANTASKSFLPPKPNIPPPKDPVLPHRETADELRRLLDDTELGIAVYDLSRLEVGEWKQVARQYDPDGFHAAVYERILNDGRRDVRIVFAGTQVSDAHDVGFDARLVSPLPRSIYDNIDEQSYLIRAQAFAAGYVGKARTDSTVASIRFVGHSLGGVLAQYLSAKMQVDSTVINSAAVSRKIESRLSEKEKQSARLHVTQLFEKWDYVQRPTRWLGGTQYGRQYMIESAAGEAKDPHSVEYVRNSLLAAIRDIERNPGSERFISQREPISQEMAELLVRNLTLIRGGLDELQRGIELRNIFRPGGPQVPENLSKSMGKISAAIGQVEAWKGVSDLIAAIREDQDQFRDKPFVPLHSKTIETLAEAAITGYSIPGVKEAPGGGGLLRALYSTLDDHHLIHFQPRVSLLGEKVEIGSPTFGGLDFARAELGVARKGHVGIDDIDAFADGVVGAIWGTVGLIRSGGNLRVAEIHQEWAQTITQNGRVFMREAGIDKELRAHFDSDFRNQPREIVAMYRTIQERRAYEGLRNQTFDEFLEGNITGTEPKNPGAAAQIKSAFRESDLNEQVSRAEAEIRTLHAVMPRTLAVGTESGNLQSIVRESELAASLTRTDERVVLIGTGPAADRAFQEVASRCGLENVKRIPFAASNFEKNFIAAEFGAHTVIRVGQERFREITRSGYLYREELPDPRTLAPRRKPDPAPPPDNLAKYLPPFRWPRPPGVPIDDPPFPPKGGGGIRFPAQPRVEFAFPSPRIGGVMLQGVAEVDAGGSPLTAGNFSLIFQGASGEVDIPTLRRFVTVLWATYLSREGPGISIDPIYGFTNRHVVRYIGRVINSDLGRVMRETDYIMKSWAVGTTRPDLENWLTPEEIGIRNGTVHVGAASRFWFIPENMRFRRAGEALLFDSGQMTVKTEYLFENKGEKNPEREEWAAQFTRRYGEVAQRYPVFEELFEYAKLVALTKYLKERRIPLLWFLLANREMVLTEDSPGTVKAFIKKSDYFEETQVFGGVDLSPGAEPGSFVLDGELLNALAEARRNVPPAQSSKSNSQTSTIEVIESRDERLTVTPSQTVVVSESRSAGDSFATDLGLRKNGSPHLEIARYRRTDFPQVHTFGRDWHLMIPYSVRPGSNKRVACGPFSVPETMVLHNNLTGFETVLPFKKELKMGTNIIPVAGYYPEQPEADLNIGLTPMSDLTFRLDDKLGCEFEFDSRGRLIRMLLADHLEYPTNSSGKIIGVNRSKDYEVSYEYKRSKLNWRDFDAMPFRLSPHGNAQVTVGNIRMPKQMLLFDAATGAEEAFAFDEKKLAGVLGYLPADTNRSGYSFLAIKTDGSLELEHKSGSQITFDPRGEFRSLFLDTLERMIQDPYEVRFEYGIERGQYRITTARVFDRKTEKVLYAVLYKYARDGNLAGASIVSAK